MPEIQNANEIEMLRVMQDFTSWYKDTKEAEDLWYSKYDDKIKLESQQEFFDFIRGDFSRQLISSLESLNKSSDTQSIDVVVSGLENITSISSLTDFLSTESIQTDDFVSNIENQLNDLTVTIIPESIYKLDNLNNEISKSMEEFNRIFIDTSNELQFNLENTNTTIDSYVNSVNSTMSSNVVMIDNTLSNSLGSVGKGLGSFISQFAIQTSSALPILGANISAFFATLSNPATLVGIGAVTLGIMGLGKGIDFLGDGVGELVDGFEQFIGVITDTDDIGDVAVDLIKMSGGVASLNLALASTVATAPASYIGLKILTNYIDDIGETYTNNKESLDSIVSLFNNINNISTDNINFDTATDSITRFVESIPIVDIEAKLNVINREEIENLTVSLTLNEKSLDSVFQKIKQVEFAKVVPSINNVDDVIGSSVNPAINNNINFDTFEIVTELQNINRTLNNVYSENLIAKKETKESIRRASFFNDVNKKEDDVGILDSIANFFTS